MLTNMSEIMSKKISVLDISIDNFTAKEAMQEALAYMESDLVSVIELVTIESLMELGTEAELKEEIENFDLILAGNKTILEAAEITDHKCLRETEDKTFLKMFLRYLARKHKRVYLLGFAAGLAVRLLNYLFRRIPQELDHIKTGLLVPLLSLLFVGALKVA